MGSALDLKGVRIPLKGFELPFGVDARQVWSCHDHIQVGRVATGTRYVGLELVYRCRVATT